MKPDQEKKSRGLRWHLRRWYFDLRAIDAELEQLYTFTASMVSERFESWSNRLERLVGAHGIKRLVIGLFSEGLTLSVFGLVMLVALSHPASVQIAKGWRQQDGVQMTFVDRNGLNIGKRGLNQNRSVSLNELPESLIQSILSTEDRRFYEHVGIDLRGIARAIFNNVMRRNSSLQGASTITQQVAKNLFLSNERTFRRKIDEAFISLWLELTRDKDEILKLYVDFAYLGNGAIGVEAASQAYFGKSVRDLNLSESAMIAGLFQSPGKNAPHINYEAAVARTREVLNNMVEANYLTESQAYWAQKSMPEIIPADGLAYNGYFLDYAYSYAKEQVKGLPGKAYIVRTTVDLLSQSYVAQTIKEMIDSEGREVDATQASAVIMEPDGAVVAMSGGYDYSENQFNRATDALRQPGSSFKPVVYATALENGYSERSIIDDAPITIGQWSPGNAGGGYAGAVRLSDALRRSLNTVAVRLQQYVGRDKVIGMAKRLGLETPLINVAPLALGVSETKLIELIKVYAAFANGGYSVQPYPVYEIRDERGELAFDRVRSVKPRRVLSEKIDAAMNRMLFGVVEAGTGQAAKIDGRQVAGKTGTTNDYRDAWFAGFTGNLVGVVWYGNDDFRPMNEVSGSRLPARTWQKIMSFLHLPLPQKPIPGLEQPAGAAQVSDDGLGASDAEGEGAKGAGYNIRLSRQSVQSLHRLWDALEEGQRQMYSERSYSGLRTNEETSQ